MSDESGVGDRMPVLEEVLSMTVDSLERSGLDARSYLQVRIAALAAMGANPVSWLVNLKAAAESGLGLEDVQAVLVGIAPVIGTARTMSAAANAMKALGFAAAAAAEDDEG
jgi:hypothetical protein